MDCDEHIILKKLRDGDSEALDILYLRYASKVRDFAFRLLKDRTDAEDVTHDIFLKIWEQRRGLGAVLSFRGYLFRMTRNAIFNAYKHRQVESKYQAETGAAESPAAPQADESVSTDDLLEMIDLAVRNMPEQRRRVFCMSRYENMSYNDIAEAPTSAPRPCSTTSRERWPNCANCSRRWRFSYSLQKRKGRTTRVRCFQFDRSRPRIAPPRKFRRF